MSSNVTRGVILLFALALVAGCGNSPGHTSPVTPTQAPGIDYFVGGWTSPFTTTTEVNGVPSGCSQFTYDITKTDANSASVTYDVVCAGYAVKGTGAATLQGSVLKWSANGTVAGNNFSCPFTFTDNTATPQGDGTLLVVYNATVCGLGPFSGSRLLQRR